MTDILRSAGAWLTRVWFARDDERGASLVEYALLVALIALVCFVAVEFLGSATGSELNDAGASVAAAGAN
jgi:pilus assembly protein Flp/PilA